VVESAFNPYSLVGIVAGIGGILAGVFLFFRRWRQKRFIEDTPQARIRSAPQGYVKLSGRAGMTDGKLLRAPLTGRACVWWTYRVQQRNNRRLPGGSWLHRDCGTSDQPFVLIDQADHCLIDPDGAEVEASDRKVWYGNSPDEVPLALWGGLNVGSGASCRFTEAILSDGAQLAVLGEFRANTGSVTNALDDEAAALLDEWKHDQPALLARFDINHDGHIDAAEWETVRAAAVVQAQHDRLHQAPEQRIGVLSKPGSGKPFLIAARSEGQLASIERRRALAALALTVLSLAVTCYALAHVRIGSG
jgi:hypothetical protein